MSDTSTTPAGFTPPEGGMQYPSGIPADAFEITDYNGDKIYWSVDKESPFTINAWHTAYPTPDETPFWHQPHDFAGKVWPDEATAIAFATQFLKENCETAPVEQPTPVPSMDEIRAAQIILAATGHTVIPPTAS